MKVTSRNASDAAGSPERAIEPSAEEMESRKDAVMEQRRDLFDRRTRLSLDVELGVPGAREVYDRLGQELKAVDERIALLYSASGEAERRRNARQEEAKLQDFGALACLYQARATTFARVRADALATAQPTPAQIEHLYIAYRALHGAANDLHDLTADRQYFLRWSPEAVFGPLLLPLAAVHLTPGQRQSVIDGEWRRAVGKVRAAMQSDADRAQLVAALHEQDARSKGQ